MAVNFVMARHPVLMPPYSVEQALPTFAAGMTGKEQQEYLQQRTLQLQAAAAQQQVARPQKSFLPQHRSDARALAAHACVLTFALLGVPPIQVLCALLHHDSSRLVLYAYIHKTL